MIFQHTIKQVLQCRKTQTRRIIKSEEVAIRGKYNQIIEVVQNGRTKWRIGQTYAVQSGRGQAQVARIRINKINSGYITRISSNDAIAEGFVDRQEFLATWKTIHGDSAMNLRVWVITFEVVSYIAPAIKQNPSLRYVYRSITTH